MQTYDECITVIREKLKELRGDTPLRTVAEATGLSVSFLSDIEHGRTSPSLKTLLKLAQYYQVVILIGENPANFITVPTKPLVSFSEMMMSLAEQVKFVAETF